MDWKMKGIAYKWTEEQDQTIRDYRMSYPEMAKLWGRTSSAVQRRAQQILGITLVNQKEWSPWETETLRRDWPRYSASQLAAVLGRTRNAVIGKAHRLKLLQKSHQPQAHVVVAAPPPPAPEPEPVVVARPKPKKKSHKKLPPNVPRPQSKQTVIHIRKKGRVTPPMMIPEPQRIGNAQPLGLLELRDDRCHATVGKDERGLATYCGKRVYPGKPYCVDHCEAFYANFAA